MQVQIPAHCLLRKVWDLDYDLDVHTWLHILHATNWDTTINPGISLEMVLYQAKMTISPSICNTDFDI